MILLSSFYKILTIVGVMVGIIIIGMLTSRDKKEKRTKLKSSDIKIKYLDEEAGADGLFITTVGGAPFYVTDEDLRAFVGFVYFDPTDEAPCVYRNDLHMMGHIPRQHIDEYRRWCNGRATYPCVGFVLRDRSSHAYVSSLRVIRPYNRQYVESQMRDYVDWVIMTYGLEMKLRPDNYEPVLAKKKT